MRAVLALVGYKSKKHSGNASGFRKLFIKTGVFKSVLSDMITESLSLRQDCDYTDHFVAELPEVTKQFENAKLFYEEVKKYIDDSYHIKPLE